MLHLHGFMVLSEGYNILEENIKNCAKDIINLGHKPGHHFDVLYYLKGICSKDIGNALKYESNIREKIQKMGLISGT